MNMKKLYSILYATLLICVVGTVVFLILSPDQIPVHYNFAGEVDRIGSKYENLLWPGFAIGLGIFFLLMARVPRKRGEKTNEKVLVIAGVCTLIFFTLLGFYFMLKALKYDPNDTTQISFDDINKFVSIGVGVLLVVLGNIMPKMRRNALFGLRTKWSMANDTVWQKSQRFGGITSVVAGFILIIMALFIPGIWNVVVMTIIIVVWMVLCIVASHKYYLEDQDNKDYT